MPARPGAPIGDMMVLVGTWAFGSYSAGKAFMLIEAATVFLALIGTTLSCLNTGARVTYAMGKDEEVPQQFGMLHGKTLSPHRAVWFLAVISIFFGILTTVVYLGGQGADMAALDKHNFWYSIGIFSPHSYVTLPNTVLIITLISNFGTFLLYMTTCIVAIVAFREHHSFHGFKHMFVPVFGLLANFGCMLFYLIGPFSVAGMSWREPYIALGVSFLWIIIGAIYFATTSKAKGKQMVLTTKPAGASRSGLDAVSKAGCPSNGAAGFAFRTERLAPNGPGRTSYFMELTYAQMSIAGPVRQRNEDTLGFWHPPTEELVRSLGIAAVIADGVGGTGRGEEATQLAVHSALTALKHAPVDTTPADLLRTMVNEANRAVYDQAHKTPDQGKMATTFTAGIFRHDELFVAHVGDSRIYLVRQGTVKRLTSDHSYVSLQVKLGLLKEHEAMGSPMRSVITRSLGNEMICGYDFMREKLAKGDVIVQCTDGLYAHIGDDEVREIASRDTPEQVCANLVALAEKRMSDDNISVQVIRIDEVEHVHYYRGAPYYVKGGEKPAGSEVQVGDVLDERFEITDLVNRSGMASIFKANDRKTGQVVAVKIPLMQFESDAAAFSASSVRRKSARASTIPTCSRSFRSRNAKAGRTS